MLIYVGSVGKEGSAEPSRGDQEQDGDTDEEIGNFLHFTHFSISFLVFY